MAFFIVCLRAEAQNDLPTPTANIETIPAGSWIIPMDNTYQGNASGIFKLKTYGLLNQLLWNNIHLKWAIKAGKGKDSADFKANAFAMLPTRDSTDLIAGANFETSPLSPNWSYSGSGSLNTTSNKYNTNKSWRLAKNQTITMTNTAISEYSNVTLSVAFASTGNIPTTGDLYMDISYDNGATWTGTGSVRLMAGNGSTSTDINTINSQTVGSNPYTINIPNGTSQINVRFRTTNTGTWNGSMYYFVDDVKLSGTYNRSFAAGPFIIAPSDTAAARTIIDSWNSAISTSTDKISVYKAATSFSADIRYNVTHKPKIVIYDDGGNGNIHEDILLAAGFTSTYYNIIGSGVIVDSINCYTLASTPHWDPGSGYSSSDSARLLNLKSFLRSGGNFLAQCHGIAAVENFAPSRYMSTAGINDWNTATTTIQYMNNDLPVMQFQGAISDEGGSIHNFNKTSGSWVYPRYNPIYFTSSGDTANIVNVTKISNNYSSVGGNMVYLGGHSYKGTALGNINGMRIYLNMVMMPSKDLQADVTATSNSPICPGDTIKLYGNTYPGFGFSWSGPNSFTSTTQNPTIANATSAKAGIYTLTMTVPANGGGCVYNYTQTAVVVSKPSLTVNTSQSIICRGDSVTLGFTSSSGLSSANWYINTGGSCAPNGTYLGSGLTKKVAPTSTTKYTAIGITSSGGCADTAINCITVTVDTMPVITSATSPSVGACYGRGVSATISPGSGGSGCSETYQWRQDGGSWQSYTSGTTVGTTAHDSIEIKATRNCTSGCNNYVRSRWIVGAPIYTTSSASLSACATSSGYIAQLTAVDPSPNTGLWTKTSGNGSVTAATSYSTTLTGLITNGGATNVKWVVTNSIGCKDSSAVSVTPPSLDTTLISKYNTHYCLSCPIQNGNTFTYYDANGKILMSVSDVNDTHPMGTTGVCGDLAYNPAGNNNPVSSDVRTVTTEQQPFLPRSWAVNPDTSNAPYQVSLYFTDEELNALSGRAMGTRWAFTDVNQLVATGYSNVNTTYTDAGGPNGIFYQPVFQRVGNYWKATINSVGAKTFYIHPITYPWAALPVELVSFRAFPVDMHISLEWITASELNNSRFEIERSTDGINFIKIGEVKGSGTTKEIKHYSFNDITAQPNVKYYYRLKQVDYKESFKNTYIVTASLTKNTNVGFSEFMPNPSQGITSIEVTGKENLMMRLILMSIDGRIILEKSYALQQGVNKIDLDLSNQNAGTYLCQLQTDREMVIKKVVKAH